MRCVIINADDFGLSDGVCRGIVELMDTGAISSTTLMLAAEGAVKRCSDWNIAKFAGRVGVHLQLTGGRPLLPASQVPTLVGPTGSLKGKNELTDVAIEDVEREWRRQIDIATEILGQKPTHLDSHHGVHHSEQFAKLFVQLALDLGMPVRDRTAMVELGASKALTGSDVVLYDWTAAGNDEALLQEQLAAAFRNHSEANVIEVVVHPGYSDDALRRLSTLNDLREVDMRSLSLFAGSGWLGRHDAVLISFGELKPGLNERRH